MTLAAKCGSLCGSGEISIASCKQGDDDGMGGVVTPSASIGGVIRCPFHHVSQAHQYGAIPLAALLSNSPSSRGLKRSVVKRDLLGVGACGLSRESVSEVPEQSSEERGYLLSIWKLASRSAVKLDVGDEPRAGLVVK